MLKAQSEPKPIWQRIDHSHAATLPSGFIHALSAAAGGSGYCLVPRVRPCFHVSPDTRNGAVNLRSGRRVWNRDNSSRKSGVTPSRSRDAHALFPGALNTQADRHRHSGAPCQTQTCVRPAWHVPARDAADVFCAAKTF
jgi:hypothetical protein